MRGVHHQQRAHLVGDLAERGEVDQPGNGRAAADDHLRPVLAGQVADLVVVDVLGLGVHAVVHRVEPLAGEADLGAVGQVAAVRQRHRQHRVAGLQEGAVHRDVGAGAGVRLQVGVLGAEQRLGPVDADLLGPVDHLAAAVVPPAGIALGVLVAQRAAERGQHRRRGEVLAGDQLQAAAQPVQLVQHHAGDLGVDLLQRFEIRSPVLLRHLLDAPSAEIGAGTDLGGHPQRRAGRSCCTEVSRPGRPMAPAGRDLR